MHNFIGKRRSDAVRTEPKFLDAEGHAFWKLRCCGGEFDMLLQGSLYLPNVLLLEILSMSLHVIIFLSYRDGNLGWGRINWKVVLVLSWAKRRDWQIHFFNKVNTLDMLMKRKRNVGYCSYSLMISRHIHCILCLICRAKWVRSQSFARDLTSQSKTKDINWLYGCFTNFIVEECFLMVLVFSLLYYHVLLLDMWILLYYFFV